MTHLLVNWRISHRGGADKLLLLSSRGGYDDVRASLRLAGLIELERPSRSTLYLPLLAIHRKIVPARPLSSAALTSPCTTTLVPVA